MDKEQRENLYRQLRENPLFIELMEYFKTLQLTNQGARRSDIGQLSTGAIYMREQGIGAENQMDDILSFIKQLQHDQ